MAKIEAINEGRVNATATINWMGKYELFQIEQNETVDTFVAKLLRRVAALNVGYLDQEGFYMLVIGTPGTAQPKTQTTRELSYVGKAVGQLLRQRICQKVGHETAFQCIINRGKGHTLYLSLGVLTESSLEKDSEKLYDDIECCLISTNQPHCNITCKDRYNSDLRRNLVISNTGSHHPLLANSNCK